MPELDYIPLFLDFYSRYSELTYEERGRLVWAMLAYAKGEDPTPHLSEDLRRFCFPNERDVIERTRAAREERRKKLKAASELGVIARRTKGNQRSQAATDGNHNNNNNYNYNNNYNDNNNKNNNRNRNKGGDAHANADDLGHKAGRPDSIGFEKVL